MKAVWARGQQDQPNIEGIALAMMGAVAAILFLIAAICEAL